MSTTVLKETVPASGAMASVGHVAIERLRALVDQLGAELEWQRGASGRIAAILGIDRSYVSLLLNRSRPAAQVQLATIDRVVSATGIKRCFFLDDFGGVTPSYKEFLTRALPLGPILDRRDPAHHDPRKVVATVLRKADSESMTPELIAAICAHVDVLSRYTSVSEVDVKKYVKGLKSELVHQLKADARGEPGARAKHEAAVSKLAAAGTRAAPKTRRKRRQA